jgi:hypothetical protein
MCSGQVKPMLVDVVEANTHINALIGFVVVQFYRLEGGPRAILPQQLHEFEFSGRGCETAGCRAAFTDLHLGGTLPISGLNAVVDWRLPRHHVPIYGLASILSRGLLPDFRPTGRDGPRYDLRRLQRVVGHLNWHRKLWNNNPWRSVL